MKYPFTFVRLLFSIVCLAIKQSPSVEGAVRNHTANGSTFHTKKIDATQPIKGLAKGERKEKRKKPPVAKKSTKHPAVSTKKTVKKKGKGKKPSAKAKPSKHPSLSPTSKPSSSPSIFSRPSNSPSRAPTATSRPSKSPSRAPSASVFPSSHPSQFPSISPSSSSKPSNYPTREPTASVFPSSTPSQCPSNSPSYSLMPSNKPSTSACSPVACIEINDNFFVQINAVMQSANPIFIGNICPGIYFLTRYIAYYGIIINTRTDGIVPVLDVKCCGSIGSCIIDGSLELLMQPLIYIDNPSKVSISGFTFQNFLVNGLTAESSIISVQSASAVLDIQSCLFTSNTGLIFFSRSGTINFSDSIFMNAIYSRSTTSGAIYTYTGTVNVIHTKFENNMGSGLVLLVGEGSINIENSIMVNNDCGGNSAIHCENSGTLNIESSTFTGNKGDHSGAIGGSYGCLVNVAASTFYNNIAKNNGGAISGSLQAHIIVANSNFIGNTAGFFGGAIWIDEKTVVVLNTVAFQLNSDTCGPNIAYLEHSSILYYCNIDPPNFTDFVVKGHPKDFRSSSAPSSALLVLPFNQRIVLFFITIYYECCLTEIGCKV